MDKKVLKMLHETSFNPKPKITITLCKKMEEKSINPETHESELQSAKKNEKNGVLKFLLDLKDTVIFAFSNEITVNNGKDASKAIRDFITRFILSNLFYLICFGLIILIPIKKGYLPSLITAIPIAIIFMLTAVINALKLYGIYIVPVKQYHEYKKNNDTGLF